MDLYPLAPSGHETAIRAIEALAPYSDRLSWLKVTWRPDWQRWCVWQMLPPDAVPSIVWGPDTRLLLRPTLIAGRRLIRTTTDPRYRLILNPELMTRWAWRIHLETGHYASPYWVIQGHRGGHKWQFSDHEAKLAALRGYPGEPPEPGTRDYAPPDARVVEKLGPLDRLRGWTTLSKALHELDERDFDAQEKALMVEANQALWDWMGSQVDEAFEMAPIRKAGERGAGYRDSDVDYEKIEQDFIESED